MHFNYFFLRNVAEYLNDKLSGARILECFSQNKNELIISFHPPSGKSFFYIRLNLDPNFHFINFPDTFYRSKRNNISFFESLYEKVIRQIRVINYDRSIVVDTEGEYSLLLKLHGNKSNVILFKENVTVSLFRKRLQKDLSLDISSLEKQVDFSREYFMKTGGNPDEYTVLGTFIRKYLKAKWITANNQDERWKIFQHMIKELNDPNIYLIRDEGKLILSLIKTGQIISAYVNPLTAANEFSAIYVRESEFQNRKSNARNILKKEEKITGQSLQALISATEKLEKQKDYKLLADLIMANLHNIHPYDSEINLPDFSGDKMVNISLKKGLSPQKNAENYYRKSKNQHVQVEMNKELIKHKTTLLANIQNSLELLENAGSVKDINEIIAPYEKLKAEKAVNSPFKVFHFMDFEIRVGKNAKSNDLTTFRHSYKEDLWLHVKDAGGSHVIIKHKSGINFPKPVIERAAQLAAFYSRRKNESMCPVIYTPRKYVRKRKGDPAGTVIVEKEKVILAEPRS